MNAALWAIPGGVLGAIAGSFLGTIVLRWPAGRMVRRGRSACDACGHALGVADLFPLLSAVVLRFRCRYCGARIDPLHWRMELAMAVVGALALSLAPGIEGLGWALFGWLLVALAVLDWRHFWLPDALTFPLAFLGFTLGLWVTNVSLVDRAIGAAIGYGALLTLALGYRALRGREGLGLGDAKLLGAIGTWLGWRALPFVLLVACLAALSVALAQMLSGKALSGSSRIPLGTFLCLGAVPGWLSMLVLIG